MPYRTIVVQSAKPRLDELETLFWNLEALSVTLEDAEDHPIYEPGPGEIPVWDSVIVSALFADTVDVQKVQIALTSQHFECLAEKKLEDRIWEREWLNRFKPMQFGENLWVCPSGHQVDVLDAVVMELDPGLAFGTGTHATTSMCLEWLDKHIQTDMRVMDFGSGSGILGIAALLLGAELVTAVDNDPQALTASRDNAIRNKVEERLETFMPDQYVDRSYDVVIANILAQPLIDLAGKLSGLLASGSSLVLSGIMVDQAAAVKKAYALEFVSEQVVDGWVCLHARKS